MDRKRQRQGLRKGHGHWERKGQDHGEMDPNGLSEHGPHEGQPKRILFSLLILISLDRSTNKYIYLCKLYAFVRTHLYYILFQL